MKKRILSMLLTIVMVMGLLPGTAWATTEELECTHTDAELSKDSSGHSKICLECGESWEPHSDADGDAAECSHAWGEWYTTVYPECEYVGVEQRACSVCGAYEEKSISALGHNWVWDTLPTASVNGTRHCTTCGTVETEVSYDASYYWTFACNNKASEIDEVYSWCDDEYAYKVEGYIALEDPSRAYGDPLNYNTMLKATSLFKSSLTGFTATVDTLEDNYIGTALEKEYPTTLSFLWTNRRDRYDGKDEYSVYTSSLVSSENGSTSGASRYGHMWNEAADGEYSLNIVLSDSCLFGGTTLYGEPDDGEYDWLYYSVVSDGNVHPLRMLQLDPVISAYEPVTVSISTAYNPETGKQDVFCKINGHVYELAEAVDTQLLGQEYYFSAAAYADGTNEATASFMMTDICGKAPDTFTGYKHECSTYHEEAATCGADGRKICAECAAVISTTPATGNHNWDDATCTEPRTCSVCDATEGEAAGHSFTDGICTDCGLLDVSLSGTTLTLLGNIGMNFYLKIHEAIRSAGDAYVELTCDKKTTRIPVNTPSGEDTSGTYYTCEVNAKQMSETITVKVVMGAYESGTFTYSVKENAAVILENKNNNEAYTKAQNVVTAMLHYGAYAQTYFGYNTDNLANAELTEQDLSQANFTGFSVTGTEVEGIGAFVGANLVLESETTLKVYFEPLAGVSAGFEVTGAEGVPFAYDVVLSGGQYIIVIKNIPAQHLDADFTITVKGTTDTFTIAALDYCGNVVTKAKDESTLYGENTADLVNLLKSMRLYNQAAESYFAEN